MGSRFGGLKQLAAVDDLGHPLIDFSLYDAWCAGFRDVVFIIKKELEADFRVCVGDHVEPFFNVTYVFQKLNNLPVGFSVPEGRVKPWGTGHAIACCKGVVDGPFAVINADDFYGRTAFSAVYDFLKNNTDKKCYAMVGYRVRNTLTENGSVSRGICEVKDGFLSEITERKKIYQRGDGAAYVEDDGKTFAELPGDTVVSMNMWGFPAEMPDELWRRFSLFLEENLQTDPLKCEYLLPYVVGNQLKDGSAAVRVLPCEEAWYGMTYREDLPSVQEAIARMKAQGLYTEKIWG